MDIPLIHRPEVPLTDDALLLERVDFLISNAIRRQFWMLFLNPDQTMSEVIMPSDVPDDPNGSVKTDDGRMTHAAALARMLSRLMTELGFAEAVFVWERPGPADVGAEERAWARTLAEECRSRDVRIRGQFLVHDEGARPLTPDDYLHTAVSEA